jgi:succinate-semialdehyde dehydrogenase/glutarate-semialdehyde dehydrogenase
MQEKSNLKLIDLDRVGLYINGEWVTSVEGGNFEINNPSTTETLGKVPKGGRKETVNAIEAAEKAFPAWSRLTAEKRAGYMLKLRDLVLEHTDELAAIMSMEMGKAYTEAKGEVAYAASFLTWYAEEGRRIYGETIPASAENKRLFVIKQPVGVVAAITPWNFPLAMLTRKLGPAMAAGCTGVVKPASQTPLTALAFAKLAEIADIPKGVINIIAGSTGEISDEIFNNPAVKKISFTGSTNVGKDLVVQSANQLKKLSLELGGHAPFIVFEDADIEKAVEGVVASKFRNAGQTCVCANRIYVHKNIKKDFSKLFVAKVEKFKVGNSLDETVDIGPLVNQSGLEKVIDHVKDATDKGASILSGGKVSNNEKGYFYEPTVLDNVTKDMKIMDEETFGPVAPLTVFEDEEEVIQAANDTEYGLASYIYTKDITKAVRVSEALDFGIIGLNDGLPSAAQAPFGGMKESGYGREGGHQGIRDYLEEKYISLGL